MKLCEHCGERRATKLVVAVAVGGPKQSVAVCQTCNWDDGAEAAIEATAFALLTARGHKPSTVKVESL